MSVNFNADDGTEHTLVQPTYLFLRTPDGGHPDLDSLSIVTSHKNQRIEAFCLFLLREKLACGKSEFIFKR